MNKKKHWAGVYAEKKADDVSWYQDQPEFSLRMIKKARLKSDDPFIDVGGGASKLVDCLLDLGHENLTVLDISGEALENAKQRLGRSARKVTWVESDITKFKPNQASHFWHDRAVFHFLTAVEDRKRYLAVLNESVVKSGHVLMATFALNGPEKCSGLPVQRYSHKTLQKTLGSNFKLIATDEETHTTPWGTTQNFIYALFKKQKS